MRSRGRRSPSAPRARSPCRRTGIWCSRG